MAHSPPNFLRLLLIALLLSACTAQPDNAIVDLFGPITATGSISATGSSLYRRGTHVLRMDGKARFFLESKQVRLKDFTDGLVVVEGELSPNTHEQFLPVLAVQHVRLLRGEAEQQLQEYTVPVLALSLSAPAYWSGELKEGVLTFTLPQEHRPFVRIEESSEAKLPEGLPIRINAINGMRFVDEEANQHHVYLKRSPESVVLFSFVPQGEESALLRDAFYTMLRSIAFTEQERAVLPEEELADGAPCGGSAGVLCAEGEYCKVQEFDTGIGKCAKL